ncbi:prepilin peptidase [Zooshikella ganghwensis]|uniref:Prepilin peptidase n=1 Tax=Zooshikella ganghwensis TaxID=202772 RepID=A0A4P9VFP6_9GAMM|nr:A24 family peptidase [Zooshikella ganghwensis]RDH41771.1 prepilin peptidase [Zooshikella ganghwensis]RDH41938.1 prepilin peptidase [Zooshikella ganghwensis]
MSELSYGVIALCAMLFLTLGVKLAEVIPFRLKKSWNENVEVYDYSDLNPVEFQLNWGQRALLTLVFGAIVGALVFLNGISHVVIAKIIFFAFVCVLTAINYKHQLYPDSLVFPCLWLGLLSNAYLNGNSNDFVYGAVTGYLLIYFIYIAFKANTGKEVIGFGDMKYFAMVGAWYGVSGLINYFIVVVILTFCSLFIALFLRSHSKPLGTGLSYLIGCLYVEFFSHSFDILN